MIIFEVIMEKFVPGEEASNMVHTVIVDNNCILTITKHFADICSRNGYRLTSVKETNEGVQYLGKGDE